jgi:DNA-binding transcriptional LysR family regulator
MELRHLRYFVAVAAEGHVTRAARKLGIAQPPLTQQIHQLEEQVGASLFIRGPRGVSLSAAGQAFLPHAEAALREATRAAVAAQRVSRGEAGTLRIGFTSAASLNPLVPATINDFRTAYPGVELRLTVQATTPLLAQLSSDILDAAFIRPTSAERESLRVVDLPDERLWIALPATHPLASRNRIRLAELRSDPFVFYPRANGSVLYDTIIATCQGAGFSPTIVQEAPQMASIVGLVAAGIGVALVPESVCQLRPEGVRYARILGQTPVATLCLACQPTGHAAAAIANLMARAQTFLSP